jgi:signal transduction histidine kinase
VSTEIPASVPAVFDAELVAGILANLLDKAEKYSRGAADRGVLVAVRTTDRCVSIEVADRGQGVSQGLRRQLFRPFTRGAPGEGAAGLGIGLALARAQARTMAGDLTFESRPDGGSIFRLELPAG